MDIVPRQLLPLVVKNVRAMVRWKGLTLTITIDPERHVPVKSYGPISSGCVISGAVSYPTHPLPINKHPGAVAIVKDHELQIMMDEDKFELAGAPANDDSTRTHTARIISYDLMHPNSIPQLVDDLYSIIAKRAWPTHRTESSNSNFGFCGTSGFVTTYASGAFNLNPEWWQIQVFGTPPFIGHMHRASARIGAPITGMSLASGWAHVHGPLIQTPIMISG